MKGSIGPMLHLGQWMTDVEVDKGAVASCRGPDVAKRVAFALAQEELTQEFFPYGLRATSSNARIPAGADCDHYCSRRYRIS